jgi:hypothetical protein
VAGKDRHNRKGKAQMAIQFSEGRLDFPLFTGDVNTATQINVFSTRVKAVHSVVMRGYEYDFKNADHHVHQIQAQLTETSIDPTNPAVVHVKGLLLLRDFSGNIDDPFEGSIDYTVIAEV